MTVSPMSGDFFNSPKLQVFNIPLVPFPKVSVYTVGFNAPFDVAYMLTNTYMQCSRCSANILQSAVVLKHINYTNSRTCNEIFDLILFIGDRGTEHFKLFYIVSSLLICGTSATCLETRQKTIKFILRNPWWINDPKCQTVTKGGCFAVDTFSTIRKMRTQYKIIF